MSYYFPVIVQQPTIITSISGSSRAVNNFFSLANSSFHLRFLTPDPSHKQEKVYQQKKKKKRKKQQKMTMKIYHSKTGKIMYHPGTATYCLID